MTIDEYKKTLTFFSDEITRIKSANAQLRGACKVALGFIKLEHLSARGEPIGSTIRILEHALKDSEI